MTILVSVVMPVYNQNPTYLSKSIESILKQTMSHFELIIIDDCSTDAGCTTVLEKYRALDSRIKIIRNSVNSGVAKSLNLGISYATAPIIARMDSDDISLPGRLEYQYNFLQKNPHIDLVGCWANVIDQEDRLKGVYKTPLSSEKIRSQILITNPLIHPTWMFRKASFNELGGYSESSPATEDYELLLRLASRKNVQNLPKILFHYRFNPNGVSYKKNKFQELQSIRLRLQAIQKGGYSYREIYKVFPSLFFYFCVPFALKAKILRLKQRYL